MVSIKDLPWVAIRNAGYKFRKVVASKDRPDREHLIVDSPREELEQILLTDHFREGWLFSFHYYGEDGDFSRSEYKHGEYNNLQLHIRLFDRDDGRTELMAHIELCPMKHPRMHLRGKFQRVDKGVQMSKGILDKHDTVYETVQPSDEGA